MRLLLFITLYHRKSLAAADDLYAFKQEHDEAALIAQVDPPREFLTAGPPRFNAVSMNESEYAAYAAAQVIATKEAEVNLKAVLKAAQSELKSAEVAVDAASKDAAKKADLVSKKEKALSKAKESLLDVATAEHKQAIDDADAATAAVSDTKAALAVIQAKVEQTKLDLEAAGEAIKTAIAADATAASALKEYKKKTKKDPDAASTPVVADVLVEGAEANTMFFGFDLAAMADADKEFVAEKETAKEEVYAADAELAAAAGLDLTDRDTAEALLGFDVTALAEVDAEFVDAKEAAKEAIYNADVEAQANATSA